MAATPENKVKQAVKAVLAEFSKYKVVGTYTVPELYQFWPVPSGFGGSSLDCIVCYYGVAIYIETKAPHKKPTPRQELTIAEVKAAGGITLVIDGLEGCETLRSVLNMIRFTHANNR